MIVSGGPIDPYQMKYVMQSELQMKGVVDLAANWTVWAIKGLWNEVGALFSHAPANPADDLLDL